MAIEARNRLLPDWFTRIRTHQTVLPRFQRYEAWDYSRVTQIFNTLLQELPVGACLILDVGDKEPFISRTLKGAPETGERVTEHLLDGQQRLTALWRGLHNNYEERTFFLVLKSDEETGLQFYVDSEARWKQENDKEFRPFWVNQPSEQWKRKMIPLHLFSPDTDAPQKLREWLNEAITEQKEKDDVADQIGNIRLKFNTFNLPFMSLPSTTQKQTALDVFIKMNTSAAPLSIYDIVVAQVEADMGKSLHDLVADTRRECPSLSSYYLPENLVLYASALLQGRSPTNATYMTKDFGVTLLGNWSALLHGMKKTIEFLEEERVFDASRLPTDVVIPVLVALWGLAPKELDGAGRARTILRQYLWKAFFSSRYEKSTNSRALTDFLELKPLITGIGVSHPIIFNDEIHPLPVVHELKKAGWPVRKDRLSRAILALALKKGGNDLADGGAATRANLSKREYHHLFPAAHLKRNGIADDQIFLSLNCALVTWQTNRNISDKAPERYLVERSEGNALGEIELKARLASHHIPYDEMVADDYSKFLDVRANLIHEAMTKLCSSGGT